MRRLLLAAYLLVPSAFAAADGGVAAPPPSDHVEVRCRWERGRFAIVDTRPAIPPAATGHRWVGRFEARLVDGGGRILESVRFDLPLLGEADAGVQGELGERLRQNVTTQGSVRLPAREEATAVEVVEARSGKLLGRRGLKSTAVGSASGPGSAAATVPPLRRR